MTDYNIRNGGKFGSSSLMLVLIVLCLTTFAFLSLGSARANEILAEKNAAAVQEYYRADGTGEEFVQRVNQALEEADGINREEIRKQALKTIGEGCLEDVDGVMARIPMAGGQVLHGRSFPVRRRSLDILWRCGAGSDNAAGMCSFKMHFCSGTGNEEKDYGNREIIVHSSKQGGVRYFSCTRHAFVLPGGREDCQL